FYADLVAWKPFEFHAGAGLWIAASAEAVRAVLSSPATRGRPPAEPVPATLAGCAAGDIFCRFLRMRDGEPHAALRQAVSGAVACHGPAAIAA
ncbi:hypothetical protein ABTN27_20210, partial [Acinetobacter baumannii]